MRIDLCFMVPYLDLNTISNLAPTQSNTIVRMKVYNIISHIIFPRSDRTEEHVRADIYLYV